MFPKLANYIAKLFFLSLAINSGNALAQNYPNRQKTPPLSENSPQVPSNQVVGKIARTQPAAIKVNTNTISQSARKTKSTNKVILFIWDGLRADAVTEQHTPNLYSLKQQGSYFSDHHASYPPVTMNNAGSLATGNYAGQIGFYGNKIWRPDLRDIVAKNLSSTFLQPVFTQNVEVLEGLDQSHIDEPLLYVETLLQVARKYGLKTAQVGDYGPITLQDANKPTSNGMLISDQKVYPTTLAKTLYNKGYALPKDLYKLISDKKLKADPKNNAATQLTELVSIDGKIPLIGLSDPSHPAAKTSLGNNNFYMDVYLQEILPEFKPDISIIWLGSIDDNAHFYGSGSKAYYEALYNQDQLLGKLIAKLDKLNIKNTTNLIIASDHGHSNVSADPRIFPLREIKNGSIGNTDTQGYSVSGKIRLANLLTEYGIKAFDGKGCDYNPALSGMLDNRSLLMPIKIDKDASVCKDEKGRLYTTKSFYVPEKIPEGAAIIAENNGSAFIYLPDGDQNLAIKIVRLLQSRQEFDGLFINDKYGDLPGTLPLQSIKFFDEQHSRHPDIVVAMSYDDKQILQGLPGITFALGGIGRGAHGSLSPIEIKNIFMALGPDFKTNYQDQLPTANVDVPVTVAYLLNLPFENRAGRPVLEAIKGTGIKASDYELKLSIIQPSKPATNLQIPSLTTFNGKEIIDNKDSYTFALNTKELHFNDNLYSYIDSGKALRY